MNQIEIYENINQLPIVVFTNFFDACYLIKNKSTKIIIDNKSFHLQLVDNPEIFSIALLSPPKDKLKSIYENYSDLPRLDFFCPTYRLLSQYKSDKDWQSYEKEFIKIISSNKQKIVEWIDGLENNKIYLLMCWENTSGDSKCHRQILYNKISNSKTLKDKAVWIYRHGNEK